MRRHFERDQPQRGREKSSGEGIALAALALQRHAAIRQARMKQRAQQTLRQVARASSRPSPAFAAPPPLRPTSTAGRPLARTFSHAASLRQQQKQQETKTGAQEEETAGQGADSAQDQDKKKKKQQQQAEENDTTVEGRSPFAAFVEVLREEVRKNREWQDSVKQLGGEVSKVQDSEAMQRAKAMYERARVSSPPVTPGPPFSRLAGLR